MPTSTARKGSQTSSNPLHKKTATSTMSMMHHEKDANPKFVPPSSTENTEVPSPTVAGSVFHDSTTSSGECLPSRSTGSLEKVPSVSEAAEQLQQSQQPTPKATIPAIVLPQPGADVGTPPTHMIICREWKTEAPPDSVPTLSSMIPEKDGILWLVKDFAAFRSAAKVSQIPPLLSPEFGGGCRLRLWLYEKKAGHIVGSIELPLVKASRDGVAHFRISVVRADLKAITKRKLDMRISAGGGSDKKLVSQQRHSPTFRLTKARCLRSPKYERLVIGDCLRVRVEFEYFPFDASVFRGFGKSVALGNGDTTKMDPESLASRSKLTTAAPAELLQDIRSYCQEDANQNVEIRRDDTVFTACRFLLCARSKRFRDIFGTTVTSSRGSPSRLGPFARSGSSGSSLSSITIQDVPADTLDQILSYIHTDTCQWLDDRSTDVLKVLDLLEGSDLYGIESLTRLLIIYLAERMDTDNFMFMYDVAERINDGDLKRLCTQFMDSLPGSQVASLMRANSCVPSPRAT